MTIDGMAIVRFVEASAEEIIRSKYTYSLIILFGFIIIAKLITFITERYILKLTAKTKTKVDDQLVEETHTPVSLLFIILGIKLAIIPLELNENINMILQRSISTLLFVVLAYILFVIFRIAISAWVERTAVRKAKDVDENLIKLSTKTTKFVLFIFVLLFVLKVWHIQVGPLLASLGIIGVAVAFGLQNTLGNVFGGVSLLLDRSIKVGDIVKADADTYGQVMDVGLRSTRIKTWDNEVVIIPNGKLAGGNIKNYVLPNPTIRVIVPFSVAYGTNVDKVKKIVMAEIKKLDNLDPNHDPMVMFLEMGSSSLDFKAFVWLKSYKERFVTKEKLNCMIYETLNKHKVNIPFPQMDVHLKGRK